MDNTNGLIQWSPGMTLATIEKQVILAAYSHYHGNKTTTSSALGICIRTLDNRLKEYEEEKVKTESRVNERAAREEQFLLRQRGLPNVWTPPEKAKTPAVCKSSETGLGVESVNHSSEECAVSVPVRKEVQSMPPAGHAQSGSGKTGESVQGRTHDGVKNNFRHKAAGR